ncbi:MAG TPA: DUF1549 domain-containing protein [Pirellulaceae bacterium]|nr:DUF1549 domain-containing protein [Pirellulaceae bacterium]
MNDKLDDPIIDACLDEVLGGQSPPDLTSRILLAWNHLGSNAAAPASSASWPSDVAASSTQQPTAAIQLRKPKAVVNSRREASPWLAIAASIAIVGLGSAIVWVVWDATEQRIQRSNQIVAPEAQPQPSPMAPSPFPESIADNSRDPHREPQAPVIEVAPNNSLVIDPLPVTEEQVQTTAVNIPDERPTPLTDEQIVRAINELMRNNWISGGITPAMPVADDEWCRRVHLKLIGREPSQKELAAFVESRAARKREELVDLLLQGETYIEEFAGHWSRTWSDILLASGDKRASREGIEQYLRRAFGQGQPFNETTSELLTATGSSTIGDANYNGATNFLVAHSDPEGGYAQATAHVSRTFMGLSLECSQCHVDSTWSGNEQQRFWELNAFFQQLKIDRNRDRRSLVSDADAEYADGETYYTLPDGLVRAAYPVFVDGTEIPRDASVEKVNRRDLLAKLVTRSEQFRQAMANRFWAELFGVGFTIPADNIGPHNPPSHPELLAKLGGQFAAHDYDVRALIRWIALSEPFALSSGDVATHDQIGAKLAFDHFPQAKSTRGPVLSQLRVAQEAYASYVSQSGVNSTPARVTPTITPGVIPMELSAVDKLLATVAAEARQLSRSTVYGNYILDSDMSIEQKIQHMFFATLHRAPSASEQKAVAEVLGSSSSPGSEKTALEYIWWALASSQEAR